MSTKMEKNVVQKFWIMMDLLSPLTAPPAKETDLLHVHMGYALHQVIILLDNSMVYPQVLNSSKTGLPPLIFCNVYDCRWIKRNKTQR